MKTRHQRITLGATLVGLLITVGCAGGPAPQRMAVGNNAAELWQHTCSHCHNVRPAPEFTEVQWPIIVNHMRTRAGLTKEQAEEIASYLSQLSARANSD